MREPRRIVNYPFRGEVLVMGLEDFESRHRNGNPIREYHNGPVVGPKYGPGISGGTQPDDRSALAVGTVRDPYTDTDWIEVAIVDLRVGELVQANWANGGD